MPGLEAVREWECSIGRRLGVRSERSLVSLEDEAKSVWSLSRSVSGLEGV